jgi:glycosyltransferase involved in cell wall biosynthesis
MRVALICGPCSPGACGVGDYTRCLANALNAIAIETHVIASGNWRLHNSFAMYRRVRSLNPDLVHIQYPSRGFATHLGPQAFALLQRCVITLHESRQSHLFRKLAEFPFSIRSKHVIFPSEFERSFATRWAPWISQTSSVLGVPSNMEVGESTPARTVNEIVHFGLIMPNKGLEDVIQMGALIRASALPLRIRIIGAVHPKYARYFETLRSQSSDLPITWENDLAKKQIENRLAASAVAYLPYPDGASEKRATLKAALINGVAVVTTRGPQTPPDLDGCAGFAQTPQQALIAAMNLLGSAEERSKLTAYGEQYARRYTWERIAQQHSALYAKVLDRNEARLRPVENSERRTSSSLEL